MNTEAIKEVLSLYTAPEGYGHPDLMTPFIQNGYAYATDAKAIIRFPKKYVLDGYNDQIKPDCDFLFKDEHNQACTVFVSDLEAFVNDPYIPIIEESKSKGMNVECAECEGSGEVYWEYKHYEGSFDRPVCNGSGYSFNSHMALTGRKIKCPDDVINISGVGFKLKYIEILIRTLQLLEVRWCEWVIRAESNRNTFKIEDVYAVIMPARINDNDE